MSEDHLSVETSLSLKQTNDTVQVAVKSRTVAALDRLLGGVLDLANAHLEGIAGVRRAKSEGEKKLIEATARYGLEKIGRDTDFAERAFAAHYRKIAQQQLNKEAVASATLEDLRLQPPTGTQAALGPEYVSDDFMSHLERYAEAASTDELREKWARVLAAEIRVPGTFSGKVLRVIDELDRETALLFERVCSGRMENVILMALNADITAREKWALAAAELIVEPGLGQIRQALTLKLQNGEESWFWSLGLYGIALTKTAKLPESDPEGLVFSEKDGVLALNCYVLTAVGVAISKILPDRSSEALTNLTPILSNNAPYSRISIYKRGDEDGTQWKFVESIKPLSGL